MRVQGDNEMREEEDMPSQGIAQRGESKPLYLSKGWLHQKRRGE
jgi:hypothetical protein